MLLKTQEFNQTWEAKFPELSAFYKTFGVVFNT